MHAENHILIFARYPVRGQAKTRLIPTLGPGGAAQLHRRMTEHTAAAARQAETGHNTAITICFTGGSHHDFRAWLGDDLVYQKQPNGDLGVRMRKAFASAFRSGARRAIAIGSDIPALSSDLMHQAMQALDNNDIALGPATDGGYYLIGMKRFHPELFTGMDWGTGRVCDQTHAAIERMHLTVSKLPTLNDVDRPADLDLLRNDDRFVDVLARHPLLSIIIPTLNEADTLPATLERVSHASDIEIIIADGGSQDATREIGTRAGATVLNIVGGRAAQQNAGSAEAKGRHLLFLHADTLVPNGYEDMIRSTLDSPATSAGAFKFAADTHGAGMRVVEWGINLRSSLFHLPYGDQGLFMEKRIFDELSGFSPLPIMEDFDLVCRLRRRGRIVILQETAITSGRRWHKMGILQTTLRNQVMIAGFFAGIAPEKLASFYRNSGQLQK